MCGFIERYLPYQVGSNSNLVRYCIADSYLRFYFKFISPISERIQQGDYNNTPLRAINKDSYQKWLGLSFDILSQTQPNDCHYHRIFCRSV